MRIAKNALWLIVCRVGGDALSLLLFVALSRHHGPAGIGEFSYGFALATFIYMATTLGLDTYAVRHYHEVEPGARPRWLGELLGAQMAMVLLSSLLLSAYLLVTGADRGTLGVVAELTAYQVLVSLSRTLFVPSVAHEHMAVPATLDLLSRIVAVGVALLVIAAWPLASVSEGLVGFPMAGVLLVSVAAATAHRAGIRPRVHLSFAAMQRIGGTLWAFAAAEIVQLIFVRVGLITLSVALGSEAAGLYSAGLKLLELACMPLVLLGVAAYPRLVSLHESNSASFLRMANLLLWGAVAASGLIAWGQYYIAPWILIPVLGEKFAGTESIVKALAAVALLQAIESLMWPMLLAAKLQVQRLRAVCVATAVNVALNLILVPMLGINGAIVASCVSFGLIVILFAITLRRAVPGAWISGALMTGVAASAAALAVVVLSRALSVWAGAVASLAIFWALVALGFWRSHLRVRERALSEPVL